MPFGAQSWEEVQHHPCILGDPKTNRTKSHLAGPTRGRKHYITPTLWGIPIQRGTESELVAQPLPARGATSGQKSYITPAFSGIPKQRGTKSKHIKKKQENKKQIFHVSLILPRVVQISPYGVCT